MIHHRHLAPHVLLLCAALLAAGGAAAQDKGSVDPQPLPPLANPDDPKLGAKELFGRKLLPAAMPTRVIGFYAKGCIAGADELPITGETWQVMRLSRNRNWAHPDMIALLKRPSVKAHQDAGIDLTELSNTLQSEGAKGFVKSWHELMESIESKSKVLT